MRSGVNICIEQKDWDQAAIHAANMSEIELTLGRMTEALKDSEQSVIYADLGDNAFRRWSKRTTHANALHQVGRFVEAEVRFREAEQIQGESQPRSPLLYSVPGFGYCDLLLGPAERAAWRRTLKDPNLDEPLIETIAPISQRATQSLEIAVKNKWLLDIALDHLTLGRASFYGTILSDTGLSLPESEDSILKTKINDIVNRLRRAGTQEQLPLGLLIRAWFRFLDETRIGPDSAREDLDEAWEIAERGPMRLYMADIHLYRARLFFREKEYPWESPEADLRAARKLIEHCGYWRRKQELDDAERVILKKSV